MALQAFQQRKYYYDFDPRSIGACFGWYDAADSNTIIYDTSGTVQAWLDKSGTARHLTQCNVNLRPGFRLSGIDMSLGLQRLDTCAFPRDSYEIFAVGYPDVSATTSNTLFHSGNNQRLFSLSNAFPGGTVWIKTPVSATGTWAGLPDARQPTTVSLRINRTFAGGLHMNGSNSSTAPTFTTRADVSYIGNEATVSSPWGVVNEILVYCNALTFKQRRFVEGYLAQKWRTTNIMQQPPAGFAPTDISGCSVWLDANDETQFDLSGSASNSVWVWRDKAGNRSDFSQNTVANRPTYVTNDRFKYVNFVAASQQTLLFDRPFLSNSVYNRAFSFFVAVGRDAAITGNNCFFGATVNSSRNQLIAGWTSGRLAVDFNGDGTGGSAGDTVTSNALVNPSIVYFEHLGSNFNFRKNLYSNGLLIVRRQPGGSNLLGGTNQSIGIANLGAGGTPYFQGRMCEVIFYDRVLPRNDVEKVHGYLFNKWYNPVVTPLLYPNHELRVARSTLVRDFRPSDIRNCVLWLDAADPTTYTLNSNNVLTSWRDKSSNRNDADICGNPVYALHPSNQKYGFYFNQPSFARGNTQLGSNIYTLFLAASIDASGATRGRIFGVTGRQDVSDSDDVSGVTMIAKTSTSNRICYLKAGTGERAPCDSSWNRPNVMIHGYDTYFFGTGQQMAHNNGVRGGTSARTPTVFAPTKYTLMGSPGCNYQDNGNGYVFETIMYNGFLGFSEMDQVQTYLGRKWGIDISSALYIANVPPVSIAERPNAVSVDVAFGTQQFNCILWLDAMDTTTYTVSNNAITRLESKGVYGGSLTTSLGATYLPGYDATGINGRPCFTTSTAAPGRRLYGTYGYASTTWGGVRNQHTVIMVVQPTSNIDASFGRLFSCWGGAGNDSTTGSGFAIATSNTTSPFTITPLRFSSMPLSTSNIIPYRTPLTLTQGTPTIISYNGQNDGGTFTPTTWAIGSVANAPTVSVNTWELKVGEVLMFQFAPSATETQAIEGYLARKWGIDLSDSHTYKYVRP